MRNLKPSQKVRALDLFCGVGGASFGATSAGVNVVAAVDLWDVARKTYSDNFKDTKVYRRKCQNLSPRKILQDVGSIDLIIASPECTSHTCAKGAGERFEESRMTAFEVIRFAKFLKPRWIVVENVIQMRRWRRFAEWTQKLENLGYHIRQQIMDSSKFSVPQSRRRLFILCDKEEEPPKITPNPRLKKRKIVDILDLNGTYRYSQLRSAGRAEATLDRADRAIGTLGGKKPFLLVYYGSDGAGGWQILDRPLRTITTVDRFAYVRPSGPGEHEMRMLQVPELKQAMGFPNYFKLKHGTRRDQIKLMGNAVCPPVLKVILNSMLKASLR